MLETKVQERIQAVQFLNVYFSEISGLMIHHPANTHQPGHREPFEKAYKVGHVLGKGGFGTVYAGVRNRDGLQVAIKHIAKAKIKDWGQVSSFLKLND